MKQAELRLLQDIDAAACRAFSRIGMKAVADVPPLPLNALRGYMRAGRAWVATGDGPTPVAFILVERVDDAAHIVEVSVHPEHARQGIGRSLIAHVQAWATVSGAHALTLTTFTHVPWNAPYYERLGFVPLADDDLTPGLRAIRERELASGQGPWPRCAMRLDLKLSP